MNYRDLISSLARPGEMQLQPPVNPRMLGNAQLSLARYGTPMPADYADFLEQTNGMRWNGMSLHGLTGKPGGNDLLLNNRFYRQLPGQPKRLYVGASESFLFAHEAARGGYQRFYRGTLARDPDFHVPSMERLITAMFASRPRLDQAVAPRPDRGKPRVLN
jgi:hypothetical protein